MNKWGSHRVSGGNLNSSIHHSLTAHFFVFLLLRRASLADIDSSAAGVYDWWLEKLNAIDLNFLLWCLCVQRFLPASSTDLLESLLQSEEDEEINEPSGGMGSSGCSGRRCSANEHCCPGTVCVDLDGRKSFHCCVRVTAIHQVALRSMAQKIKTRPKLITCINLWRRWIYFPPFFF
jgi:hypothetical protein